MTDATLEKLLDEAKASGATNWVAIIAGAQGGHHSCREIVRDLLSTQAADHWSRLDGPGPDYE